MRILYGVTGEGMGHAMRARVAAEHLVRRGHRVRIAASGRACALLRRHHEDVVEIEGFSLCYARGRVDRAHTLRELAGRARRSLGHNAELIRTRVQPFRPDVCLTDFDSFAHAAGVALRRPVVSLDHQHVLSRCRHSRRVRRAAGFDLLVARAVVRVKLPGCRHYLVSSFYAPPVRCRVAHNTTMIGPLLRREVLERESRSGGRVLVYQTGEVEPGILRELSEVREHQFVVYGRGNRRGMRGAPVRSGNVQVRPFEEARFLDELCEARAVITNGGHTAIAEALHYGKRVLSIPMHHQGEQALNAAYLEETGYGKAAQVLDRATVRSFLDRPWSRRTAVATPAQDNQVSLQALDRVLDEVIR